MKVVAEGAQKIIRLTKEPPENFCRPAVDPMLRSVAAVYGRHALAVVLTGMGTDGMRGAQTLVAAGGSVIAQDEATSVVWGMPGAVATAGLCSAVLPLRDISPFIRRLVLRTAA
jgi:two-component system chemotaxis response regulator CheB